MKSLNPSIFLFLGFVFILISCNENPQEHHDHDSHIIKNENVVTLSEAQLKNINIKTGVFSQKNIFSKLKVHGRIDVPPQNMISVSVPLGGFLKYTKLLPGMHIDKGEVIATMEDQQYIQFQQEYLNAVSNLKFAEIEYQRQKDLNQSKASSNKALELAEASYKSLQINVRALSEKLKLIGINPETLSEKNISRTIEIHSPIDGYVSTVNVNVGKYVNPTEVLFELVNPEDIHLELTVYEKDLDHIYIDQKLVAYTNANPDIKYPCEIILIGKDISHDRSVEVHCHFEKYDKKLIPGMFMNAELEVTGKNAMVVPDDALVRFENQYYLFVPKSKNSFEMIEVKTGISEAGHTEIISPENLSGKTIVTQGAYYLLMQIKNDVNQGHQH